MVPHQRIAAQAVDHVAADSDRGRYPVAVDGLRIAVGPRQVLLSPYAATRMKLPVELANCKRYHVTVCRAGAEACPAAGTVVKRGLQRKLLSR